jgi:hypothetical protein
MTPPDSPGAPGSVGALPVLTEVVDWPSDGAVEAQAAPVAALDESPIALPPLVAPVPPAPPAPPVVQAVAEAEDARAVEDAVMAELQQRVDLMFEYRLREALAPTLARVTDLLIREAREEVALTLRDVVSRAVAQEIARRRQRR